MLRALKVDQMDGKIRYNLTALSKLLKEKNRHPRLVNAISRAAAAVSALQDLKSVQDCLIDAKYHKELAEWVEKYDPESNKKRSTITSHYLVSYAIVVYCRATHTHSDERLGWFDPKKLSVDNLVSHEKAVRLRNTVIAHFGHGKNETDGHNFYDALSIRYFVYHDEKNELRTQMYFDYSSTRNLGLLVINWMQPLVEEVIKLSEETWEKRAEELSNYLMDICKNEPEILNLIHNQEFDWEDVNARIMGLGKYANE